MFPKARKSNATATALLVPRPEFQEDIRLYLLFENPHVAIVQNESAAGAVAQPVWGQSKEEQQPLNLQSLSSEKVSNVETGGSGSNSDLVRGFLCLVAALTAWEVIVFVPFRLLVCPGGLFIC